MKRKLICIFLYFLVNGLIFAGDCPDHGPHSRYYCPKCEYNKASNKGNSASSNARKYNDAFCNSSNENKEKICRDGYSSGYGDKIWCDTCDGYFPIAGHSCKVKK